MTLETIAVVAIAASLVVGALFTLVAGIGLLKLNGAMPRLHAPTKAGTLGIGAFLMASMIHSWTYDEGSLHELLIMGFLFVTAPVTANFLAKVNIHRRDCDTPPEPPRDDTWSTLLVPVPDQEQDQDQAQGQA
ncbi:monovalent cation/H(+) antiporter subunit G [Roseisalinus antarcticus]|uniref:Na(+)/H(+) antiporter subunit G n=1 Tax=Roseisalinus antarcticus TaxID=254357 RepID=A0A1Y5RE17_9RHOB|nr:monovalent cation/H(+) antiporter subunit G [Roseisalinus antarcticus]SLN15283.1 Na(+)/H(+) antiporter subunit G [Roseisalinus antarcticus]